MLLQVSLEALELICGITSCSPVVLTLAADRHNDVHRAGIRTLGFGWALIDPDREVDNGRRNVGRSSIPPGYLNTIALTKPVSEQKPG